MRSRSSRLVALAALVLAPTALAGPPAKPGAQRGRTAKLEPPTRRGASGRSVGSPTDGHLVGGAHLEESPHLRIVPAYSAGDARWGLEALVGLIDQAARSVRKQFPDAVLSVGHLSRPGGGEIDRHASHESGRDADIGFYVRNLQGRTVYADHFVAFKGDGTAPTWPGAQFDDAKNWALVAAMASNTHARISHIFVASPIRARLLHHAQKVGAPVALRSRAAALMAQPKGALPHDDHFHVRIACPPGMVTCIEQPLARRRPRTPSGKAAVASIHPPASPATKSHQPPASHPPPSSRVPQGHGPALRKAPLPPAPKPRSDASEASKSEGLVPSLAPMVQGLDSVVIPAPLVGSRLDEPEDKPALPASDALPIDDPDGVLDNRR